MLRGSNPDGSKVFRTRPHWSLGPLRFLYNWYRVLFPGVKRPWRGLNHPTPCSAEVKEIVVTPLLSLWAFVACSGVNFTFYLLHLNTMQYFLSASSLIFFLFLAFFLFPYFSLFSLILLGQICLFLFSQFLPFVSSFSVPLHVLVFPPFPSTFL
jgi:hypothetical protein